MTLNVKLEFVWNQLVFTQLRVNPIIWFNLTTFLFPSHDRFQSDFDIFFVFEEFVMKCCLCLLLLVEVLTISNLSFIWSHLKGRAIYLYNIASVKFLVKFLISSPELMGKLPSNLLWMFIEKFVFWMQIKNPR